MGTPEEAQAALMPSTIPNLAEEQCVSMKPVRCSHAVTLVETVPADLAALAAALTEDGIKLTTTSIFIRLRISSLVNTRLRNNILYH